MDNGTRIRRESEEVLYDQEAVVRVSRRDVDFLKENAEHNQRKRIRLCTHGNIEDTLHEMFITHAKGTYVRPHKHLGKIESFHVIEGSVDVVLFDDAGNISGITRMGDYQSGRPFYHRISDPSYHTLLITSEILVFHEITNGPFRREDTSWAVWAPDQSDWKSCADYMERLQRDAEAFQYLNNK